MPLTTYTSGEVLTAASLNANLVFAAANPPGGLTFITGASFSAVTSFSLPNDTFTSTYENYLLSIKMTTVATNANLTGRLRLSGTDNSTNVYQHMCNVITNANSSSLASAGGQTSFNLNKVTASATLGYHAQLQIMAPKLAEATTIFCFTRGVNAGITLDSLTGAQSFETGTAFDSFSVISSVATNITGDYKVYGYANS